MLRQAQPHLTSEPIPTRRRWLLAGTGLAGALIPIALSVRQLPGVFRGDALLLEIAAWWLLSGLAVLCLLRAPVRGGLVVAMTVGIALRLVMVGPVAPLSDDFYRYAWDGRVQAAGIDPYRYAPLSAPRELRDDWLFPGEQRCAEIGRDLIELDRVTPDRVTPDRVTPNQSGAVPGDRHCTLLNRPSVPTLYPPLAQAWFWVLHVSGLTGLRDAGLQTAGLIVDLGVLLLLAGLLRRGGHDPRWLAVWALTPLPVLEAVANGHVDGLAALLTLAAIRLAFAGAAPSSAEDSRPQTTHRATTPAAGSSAEDSHPQATLHTPPAAPSSAEDSRPQTTHRATTPAAASSAEDSRPQTTHRATTPAAASSAEDSRPQTTHRATTRAAASSAEDRAADRRLIAAAAVLGLATLVKLYPALLLPALLAATARSRRPGRVAAASVAAFAAVCALGYLPHVLVVGTRVLGYLPGYAAEERYTDGSRYLLLSAVGLTGAVATVVAAGVLAGVGALVVVRRPAPALGATWLYGALLLLVTPVQPWYALGLGAVAVGAARPEWLAVGAAAYPVYVGTVLDQDVTAAGRISYAAAAVLVVAVSAFRARGRWRTAGHPGRSSPVPGGRGRPLPAATRR